jgi:CRISPR-associated endonuclease/helicase Cas3
VDNDAPQPTVTWRKYLPVRVQGKEATKKDIEEFFDVAPSHLSEKLEVETWRVFDWLGTRATALVTRDKKCADSVVAFALDSDGRLRKSLQATELVPDDNKESEKKRKEVLGRVLAGATLIVDWRLGGLSGDGLLDAGADPDGLRTADDGEDWPVDVGFRLFAAAGDKSLVKNRRVTFSFAIRQSSEGEDIESLMIETAKTENSRAASSHPQLLEEHQSWAEVRARKIATALGLTGNQAEVVAIAARLHDEGKKASRWQRAFNAKSDAIYAKTKGPLVLARLGGYRHEFGSLPYAEKDVRLQELPTDLRDLVLHLIAAHHGRARPVIGTEGWEDASPSVLETRARDVALRFARLQKQWGPWGLAWWEALLRAADQQASRDNDNRGNGHG